MSLLEHKMWPKLKRYIHIQTYSRDGGHRKPRFRIELAGMSPALRKKALAATMPCVACGEAIHPIRERQAPKRGYAMGNLYYACSCPLSVNIGCSRGAKASDEYRTIKNAL